MSAGLAFVMVSSTLRTLQHIAFHSLACYPYKLWKITEHPTEDVARELLGDPLCLRDEWSNAFLHKYATPETLLGEGRTVLMSLGLLFRWDICRIECRNAAIKRLMGCMSGTWKASVANVSADFVLMRQRVWNACLPTLPAPTPALQPGARQLFE